MARKACRKEWGKGDSETNRKNFFTEPKEIRHFSSFSHIFRFVLPKKPGTPIHLKITCLHI